MMGYVILTDIGKVVKLEDYNENLVKYAGNNCKGYNLKNWVMEVVRSALYDMEVSHLYENREGN